MGGDESGASIVQVCVPEFNSVDFRVVKERRCVICTRRGNDKLRTLWLKLLSRLKLQYLSSTNVGSKGGSQVGPAVGWSVAFWLKFWLVSTLALSLCMCPRVSRWFLLVLFLVPLSSPWWGQPGHIVRLVPYLPLLFALYTFPSLFSFLSLGFSLSLRAWLVSFVGFSLCFIPTFSLLWPAWA